MRRVPKPTSGPCVEDLREADLLVDYLITRLRSALIRTEPRNATACGVPAAALAAIHADLAVALVLCHQAAGLLGEVVIPAPSTTTNRPKSGAKRAE